MAKKRYITTEFWRDSFIDDLDPIEKLLFLYLICNPATNLCGIYQLPLRIIASDTGIDSRALENIFIKFANKKHAYYIDGWVILPNAPKHQDTNNEKILLGIERELNEEVSKEILDKIHTLSIPYLYPTAVNDTLTKLNLTKLNLTKKKESRFAPPSLEEVSKYCRERQNGIIASQFIDFYSSKGWLIGKNKMKDWKAAIRTWENRNKPIVNSVLKEKYKNI